MDMAATSFFSQRFSGCSLLLTALLALNAARAQPQFLPAPAATPATAPPTPDADVIVRLDGQAAPGRALVLTPTVLRYLPAPPAAPGFAPTPADTLSLPVAAVFLVRYANGTRQVLTYSAARPSLGDGRPDTLSAAERQRRGRADALQYYRGRKVFWESAGLTVITGPLFGLLTTGQVARKITEEVDLQAAVPALRQDADYRLGYQQAAHHIRRRKAWAGYGAGVGLFAGILLLVGWNANPGI